MSSADHACIFFRRVFQNAYFSRPDHMLDPGGVPQIVLKNGIFAQDVSDQSGFFNRSFCQFLSDEKVIKVFRDSGQLSVYHCAQRAVVFLQACSEAGIQGPFCFRKRFLQGQKAAELIMADLAPVPETLQGMVFPLAVMGKLHYMDRAVCMRQFRTDPVKPA